MKVLQIRSEACTECGECEKACARLYFKDDDREKAALHVTRDAEGKIALKACVQCGECINVCPVQALYRAKNGNVLLNRKVCVGCLACVGFCPTSVMFYHKDLYEPIKCISCGACVKACPADALFVEEKELVGA
ncbi:MAG: 4Fe-4S binding protein [Candidatus Eremiobacteraeota bacterium]|nr:4Fe-4S binding protein [Candidatus Eremiobacteraeota bacterium]